MIRTAQCSCGELQIALDGDPQVTLACNCTNCQRRTGAAFGVVAYFALDSVRQKRGDGCQFTHLSDSQRKLDRTFCGNCGTTVYWHAELFPGMIGVAVGCFTDPAFPEPSFAAWHKSKLDWVEFPGGWMRLEEQDASRPIEPATPAATAA